MRRMIVNQGAAVRSKKDVVEQVKYWLLRFIRLTFLLVVCIQKASDKRYREECAAGLHPWRDLVIALRKINVDYDSIYEWMEKVMALSR